MSRFKMNEESRTLYLARALYDAVEDCNIQQVNTLLIQNKANPNILIPEEGMTPFHLGAGHENLAFGKVVTRLFLHNNGDPNVRCDGNRTVLHIAVAWNRSAVVEVLLKSPYIFPNPYIKDDDDLNVFNYAVKFNAWESLATLQSHLKHSDYSSNSNNSIDKKLQLEEYVEKDNSIFIKEQKTEKTFDLQSIFNSSDNSDYHDSDESLTSLTSFDDTNMISIKHDSNRQNDNLSNESHSDTFSDILNKNISSEYNDTRQSADNLNKNISSEYNDTRQSADNLNMNISSEYNGTRQSSGISLNNYFDVLTSITSTNDKFENIENISFPFDNLFDDATDNILSQSETINTRNDEFMTDISGLSSFLGSDEYFTCSDIHTSKINSTNMQLEDITHNTSLLSFEDNLKSRSINELFTETYPIESSNYESTSSDTSSLTDIEEDYDTDYIRQNLRIYGHPPGPLVPSTKRLYARKLNRIIKDKTAITNNDKYMNKLCEDIYSSQLNRVLIADEFDTWKMTIKTWSTLEKSIISQNSGSSFTYLLLDPRITKNLPDRADQINNSIEIWKIFISSIFYIGKGTKSRPYSHMNDAFNAWIKKNNNELSHKEEYILNIWKEKLGVVCVQAFHNLAMEEAFIRESCMIDALGLNNLTNIKRGTYTSTMRWTFSDRCKLGCYLLYRAMHIFLADGERQLKPMDLT